ncbi:MAG TPA: hydrogenase [Elusimicrobiota bacterium]|nr:hydrogenase [Elusimicrobiota bacterium]
MLKIIAARFRQGFRTAPYPKTAPSLPDRFRGKPIIDSSRCPDDCRRCVEACPTEALRKTGDSLQMDLGRCLFCADCEKICPSHAVSFSKDHRLAVRSRKDLILTGEPLRLADALDGKMRRLFGRSLKLRQVSAGGCNACEADVNVLNTLVFDLGRFGIQFVASPRHADGLLITGPVTQNMDLALRKTFEALPSPAVVIAVGSCAISGGPFIGHPEIAGCPEKNIPIDLFIPGCPPHPYTILDGLLRLLDRLESSSKK